jgi:putative spermidine/putrescine transport system ATP-binding protein
VTGDPHAFTIRPEKIAIVEPSRQATEEECTATGAVREVVYLGAVTRYFVELDAGGTLVVMQQNLATSSMEALQVRGRAVRLVWRRGNNRRVEEPAGATDGSMDQEEGTV